MKIMNVSCLIIWIIQLVLAVACTITDTPINHILYIIAVLMCILHYIGELVR